MARRIPAGEVEQVWEAWRATRPRPSACVFTAERRRLIRARLRLGYEAEHLVAVIRYANEADEPWPRWMRGDNPRGRAYLDLENLLRVHKLGERVEAAIVWMEGPRDEPSPAGVELGPMSQFGRG